MMARTINGSEQLLPTLAAAFLLAGLHRAMGAIACRWDAFSGLIKGHGEVLVEKGVTNPGALKKHHFGEDDLHEELRLNGVTSVEQVDLARLERSGDVSVIKKE
jgi:uncharacterized membrane protein YcaP (DUF421 family)